MAKCEQRPCVEKEDNLMMGGTEGHRQGRAQATEGKR